MNLTVAHAGRSLIAPGPGGPTLALAADLRRDPVSFDARLRPSIPLRRALGAFAEILLGAPILERLAPLLDDRAGLRRYWAARDEAARHLLTLAPGLRRPSMPFGPLATVAPDVLLFEGFAEPSAYACLSFDRDLFVEERDVKLGTTGVEFSEAVRDGFQLLGGDRPPRLRIGPVGTAREEVLDLASSWLRGQLLLQAALSLPIRRVALGREGLYNILAFLRRHEAAKGPRAVRFELTPGRPPSLILEPWGERIEVRAGVYDGPKAEVIRVWGRERLSSLAGLLPAVDGAEVFLLGTGLPSFWSARMGGIRLLLGVPGGAVDGPALARLGPPVEPGRYLAARVAEALRGGAGRSLDELTRGVVGVGVGGEAEVLAALVRLAGLGRVVHEPHSGLYRDRPMTATALSADRLGPEDAEAVAGREIARTRSVRVALDEARPDGLRALEGEVLGRPAALMLDADGRPIRARCSCSHRPAGGLRNHPCRHLRALLEAASGGPGAPASLDAWLASLRA